MMFLRRATASIDAQVQSYTFEAENMLGDNTRTNHCSSLLDLSIEAYRTEEGYMTDRGVEIGRRVLDQFLVSRSLLAIQTEQIGAYQEVIREMWLMQPSATPLAARQIHVYRVGSLK